MLSLARDDLIETFALLHATVNVLMALDGGRETGLSQAIEDRACELEARVLGRTPDTAWEADPIIVARQARAYELAADVLDKLELSTRSERQREYARRVRAAGSLDAAV